MNTQDLEKKASRLKWAAIFAGAVVLFAVVAPVVFLALKGLAGAVAFLLIGSGTMTFLPVMGMKFANWKLKALKAEARKNPIETQQAILMKRGDDLVKFRSQIEAFSAKVKQFEDQAKQFAAKYPGKGQEYAEQLNGMRQLLELRKNRYLEAKQQLQTFSDAIEEQKARYEMALAASDMKDAASGFDDAQVWDKIKVDESMSAVNLAVNTAFSQLDSILLEEDYNHTKAAKLVGSSSTVDQTVIQPISMEIK